MPLPYKCVFITIILWMHFGNVITQKGCPLQETILPCRCLMKGEEYQIWCTHSDLPTVLGGLKAVAKQITAPIDELILENNILPSLPGRTFFPLKVLRLMLRYNSLDRISSDWLAGLQTSLLEIFIVEPRLRSLPDDSLSKLNALQAVTIQTNLLKRLPLFSGLPNLRYLQIESESLLELSPANFKNNPSLENLHVTSSPRLTKLEANLLRDLPSLKLVNFSHCGISWMHPRSISKLPALKELWLVGNKITDAAMVGKGIRELPQLETVRLDHNRIGKLGGATFVDLPAIKKIYLSNNRIAEMDHGAFHRVPSLKSLDLDRNMLRRVHPESFLQQSGSGLEELSLVENDIGHVGELRSLLDSLPRLVFLDMSFNNLEIIPFGVLRGHPTLEYLNLDYNKLRQIDREAFMAMPALRELRMRNNSLSDKLVSPLWNLPELKGLDLSGNAFKRLKPDLLANLPSLRRIDLSNNELTAIDPASFLSTPLLEHVNISHNNLNGIHRMTFRHLVNLYELDVSHNELLQFVEGVPKGVECLHVHHNKISEFPSLSSPDLNLPSLRMLNLASNRIEAIPNGLLATLPQLRRLYLGKNLLQTVEENSLAGLNHLETLDLQENRMTQIHPNAFKEMMELKDINLKNNRLDILSSDTFKHTPILKRLDISRNQLAEISPGIFDKNLNIQVIDVSHNVLVQVPVAFQGLKRLRILNLTHNRIKNMNSDVIGSLANLREIKLSNNFVQEMKRNAFNDLQHLKAIYLDNNDLEYMEPNSLRALPALKAVMLNRNKMKEIPGLAFNNLPSLQIVELQENELFNIAPNAFELVPNLLVLNISYNRIEDIERAGLHGTKSLEMLDISKNRITRMASPSLEKMEWLVELRMDNNEICSVQGFTFNGMPRLRSVSLKNNKIMTFPEQAIQRLRGNIAVFDIDGNPLICGCNMLWLQVWLQELDQPGPHCIDGQLLRKTPLSRQDCSQQGRNVERAIPECNVELLASPGLYKTSQVSPLWMNLKSSENMTADLLGTKNYLAPTPEESDYFYDDYVDYPYNESLSDSNGLHTNKYKNKENGDTVTMKVPLSTKSPHFIPGDTPTLYAGIKNKTRKPDIPPKVNNSPSSSGFTFFGVPLPSLNLNQLLGSGSGRLEGKQPSATAERKIAIINDPIRNTGRSHNVGNASNPPFTRRPHYMGNMHLPSLPELQTGFVPMLPGSGGFKPIPNPALQTRRPQNNINVINNTVPTESPSDTSVSPSTPLETVSNYSKPTNVFTNQNVDFPRTTLNAPFPTNIKPSSSVEITNTYSKHKETIRSPHTFNTTNTTTHLESKNEGRNVTESSVPANNTKVSVHVMEKATNFSHNSSGYGVNITTKITEMEKKKTAHAKMKTESPVHNSSRHDVIENVSVFVEEISTFSEETTLLPEMDTSTIITKVGETGVELNENKSLPTELSASSSNPKVAVGTAEVVSPNITSILLENGHLEETNENQSSKEPKASMSTLLINENKPSQLKHVGRPTITKVPSPHISANSPLQSSLEVSRLTGPLPYRDGTHNHEYLSATTTERGSDQDADWYFANYNKTNLEPYVAKITNSSLGVGQFITTQYLQLFIVFYYVKILLDLT